MNLIRLAKGLVSSGKPASLFQGKWFHGAGWGGEGEGGRGRFKMFVNFVSDLTTLEFKLPPNWNFNFQTRLFPSSSARAVSLAVNGENDNRDPPARDRNPRIFRRSEITAMNQRARVDRSTALNTRAGIIPAAKWTNDGGFRRWKGTYDVSTGEGKKWDEKARGDTGRGYFVYARTRKYFRFIIIN